MFTAVACLGVVTAYPGFVAASVLLRNRAAFDRGVGLRSYVDIVRGVGWEAFVVPPLVAALLVLDGLAVASGVPGASVMAAVLIAASAAAAVVLLRSAATYFPGTRWREHVLPSAQASLTDFRGTFLLLLSAVTFAVVVTAVPVVLVVALGPLALAAVGAVHRPPLS